VRYWNNGEIMKKSVDCPGHGWQLGMLTENQKYWNNGVEMKRSIESPGPEWVLGRLKRKG
jgi:hypothetical protein